MINWNKYLEIPYEKGGRTGSALDCFGLVKLFYCNEFGVELDDYESVYYNSDVADLDRCVKEQKVLSSFDRTNNPEPTDLILFKVLGYPVHVGIYINNRKFLHASEGDRSKIADLDKWRKRIEGFYRLR